MSIVDTLLADLGQLAAEELPKLEALAEALAKLIAGKRAVDPVGAAVVAGTEAAADAAEDAKFGPKP